MSETTRPAALRRRARVMRAVNGPMRLALRLPFRTPLGGQLMLAYLTGRRTGRHYRQPLSYVRDGETLLTPGGGNWTRNVQDGRPVALVVNGRQVTAIPEFVGEPTEVEHLLDRITEKSPRAAKFVPLPRTPEGRLEPTALANATRHGFGIVRWRLAA